MLVGESVEVFTELLAVEAAPVSFILGACEDTVVTDVGLVVVDREVVIRDVEVGSTDELVEGRATSFVSSVMLK